MEGKKMAQAVSISLGKFTQSVQAAVKAAVAKHPKFKLETPHAVAVYYLIRGFPVPDGIASHATVSEMQAFATDVATHIAGANPEAFAVPGSGPATEGAVLSIGKHLIVGIPPMPQILTLEK
jgi:hypothetical protein